MTASAAGPFDHVPRSAGGHFVINLYAAIYRLLHQTRRFAELSGASLEQVFERYPFLGEYFNEMRRHMPDDITWDGATGWWRAQIETWERDCEGHLPLRALAEQAALPFSSRLAFMGIGLVEEDSRFGTLLAELQEPLAHRRPTLELAGQMMMDEALVGESDPWTVCRPLLAAGLVEVQNKQAPRSEWLLRVPPLLWDAVRGQIEDKPAPWCRMHPAGGFAPVADLVFPAELLAKLAKIPALLADGRARVLVLRSAPGIEALQVAGAVARALDRGVVEVDADDLADGDGRQLLGPFAALSHALPCVRYDLGPGETGELPPLTGYAGPVVVIMGAEGGLGSDASEASVTLTLPAPGAELRARHWRDAVNGHPVDELDAIVEGFHLGGGFIRQLARAALAHAALRGRRSVALADVREASRALNRQMLDTLASPMPARGSWDDLVAVPGTRDKLWELERRCRFRERLLAHLGPAFGVNAHRGVRALFTGASGTGKTLAARILAAVLGMDLYRVDLAAVVNKYIGETEKNLHQVLSRAEALDVVLLLDEGDALLGSRTEVKSANDRYANLETNYLLQRLEHYQGIVVVTTNLGDNIDQAFQRRMDVVVPFFAPQPEERLHILRLHLPLDHQIAAAFLERVALRCTLSGSQIRNAALHGTLLALEEHGPMQERHLEEGVRSEYRKAGGLCPLDARGAALEPEGGVDSFLAAFTRA
jgi:hypothetical protein